MGRRLILGAVFTGLIAVTACNESVTAPQTTRGPIVEAPSNECIDDFRAVRILEQQLVGTRTVRVRFRVEHFCSDYTAAVAISHDGVNFTIVAMGTNLTQSDFEAPVWALQQTRCGDYLTAFVRVSAWDRIGIVEETIAPIHAPDCNPPHRNPPAEWN